MSATRSLIALPNLVPYVILHVENTGNVMKVSDSSIVAYVDANYATYALALTQSAVGSALFTYVIPSTLAPGTYREEFRNCVGGAPVSTNAATTDGFIKSEISFVWNGSAVTGSASTGANQITVGAARSELQDAARNAGVSGTFANDPYSAAEADRAIQNALTHFMRKTKCVRQTDTAVISNTTNTLDFSGVTGFHTERIFSAWARPVDSSNTPSSTPIKIVDYEEILDYRRCNTSHSGVPCRIGFISTNGSDGESDNDVTFDWTIFIRWWPTLTSWTAGDSGASSQLINMPADMATKVIRTLAVVRLQQNQPEQQKTGVITLLQAEYDKYELEMMGSGNLGVRSIRRTPASELRRERGWRW